MSGRHFNTIASDAAATRGTLFWNAGQSVVLAGAVSLGMLVVSGKCLGSDKRPQNASSGSVRVTPASPISLKNEFLNTTEQGNAVRSTQVRVTDSTVSDEASTD